MIEGFVYVPSRCSLCHTACGAEYLQLDHRILFASTVQLIFVLVSMRLCALLLLLKPVHEIGCRSLELTVVNKSSKYYVQVPKTYLNPERL